MKHFVALLYAAAGALGGAALFHSLIGESLIGYAVAACFGAWAGWSIARAQWSESQGE